MKILCLMVVMMTVMILTGCGGGGGNAIKIDEESKSIDVVRWQGNWTPVSNNEIRVGDIVDFRPVNGQKITEIKMTMPNGTIMIGPASHEGTLINMAGQFRFDIYINGKDPTTINLVAIMPSGIVPINIDSNAPLIMHDNGNYLCDRGKTIKLTVYGRPIDEGNYFIIKIPSGTELKAKSLVTMNELGVSTINYHPTLVPPQIRVEVAKATIYGLN